MPSYKGGTDQNHKVQLKSQIVSVHWKEPSGCVGESAAFVVETAFVGDGADAALDIRTRSGKSVDRLSGKILRDRLVGEFQIPQLEKEELYIEAQLKKHGLQARSNLLTVFPRRAVTNARWDKAEAASGDEVKLLADTKNILDDTPASLVIFEEDQNGSHAEVARLGTEVKANRIEAVWGFEYHENVKDIPIQGEAECGYVQPKYFFEARVGKSSAKSGLLKFQDWVEFEFENLSGKEEYVVHCPDGSKRKGKFDVDGKVRFERDLPGRYGLEIVLPS